MTAPQYRSIWAISAAVPEPEPEPMPPRLPRIKGTPRPRLPTGKLNTQLRNAVRHELEMRHLTLTSLARYTHLSRNSLVAFLGGGERGTTLRSLEHLAKRFGWRVSVVNRDGEELAVVEPKE